MEHIKHARTEREEKVKQLTQTLEAGVKDLFESDRYKEYLSVMSRFPKYSANNCALILMQNPDATAVAGIKHWNSLGRSIAPGEKGLQIIQPAPRKVYRHKTARDQDGNVIYNEDGTAKQELVLHNYMNFTVGHVWDYSQTVGPTGTELPSMVKILDSNPENAEALQLALAATTSAAVCYEDFIGRANGYYDRLSHRIVVKASLPPLQKTKTLAHECCHSILHCEEGIEIEANRHEKEIESESISFIICSYYGLDTSDYSFGYIQSYASSKTVPELQTKMEVIRKTAASMIEKIDEELERLIVVQKEVEEQKPMRQEVAVFTVQDRQHTSYHHRRR